ncbi:hypothetical protein [Actinacidiphila glaucinigra]|uniref:hypothetical protein n=1 Tax=Actinacidiphila glaucinigra TaxID=235986 RepID=UPI00366B521C
MTARASTPNDRHERLTAMRAQRRCLDDRDVEPAIEEVDSSGLVPLLEEFVHLPRGRHRRLHLRTLLIGLHLCCRSTGGKLVLERTTDLLCFRLSPHMRTQLQVPDYADDDRGFEAAYAVVRRLFHAMKGAMDPSPLPPNKHLTRQEAQRLIAAADPDELAAREHRLALFTEFVLDASIGPLRGLLTELASGIAVDATPVRTYARGRRAGGPELSTDPDAGWYVREGDHRDPDGSHVADDMEPPKGTRKQTPTTGQAAKPSLAKRYLFGFDAHLAVTRDTQHLKPLLDDGTPDPDVLPALVLGLCLDKPGERPAYNGLKTIRRLQERGYTPGFLAGDRAYNNSEPHEWQLPVRALGYKPVYDYRVDQLGNQGGAQGAILVEGTWYCPSMPQPLIDATSDLHASRIDRETWAARIAARKPYRLMPKEREDAEGHQRMMCPAESGKVQCPLKPRSLGSGVHLPLVDPQPSPTGPLKVCRQRAITLAPEEGAKHWQALDYGDEQWQKIYFRLRNSVEGFNGFAKSPLAETIESSRSRPIRGLAAQTILLVFQIAHANRRKITTWLDSLALGGQRPIRRTNRRRRTKPLGTWTPTGHLAATT